MGLVAFVLSGQAVATLLLSEVWLDPDPWPWIASIISISGAAVAVLLLVRHCTPQWLDPPRQPSDVLAADEAPGTPPYAAMRIQRMLEVFASAPLRAAAMMLGLVGALSAMATLQGLGDRLPARDYLSVLLLWLLAIALYLGGGLAPARPPSRKVVNRWLRQHAEPLRDGAFLALLGVLPRVVLLMAIPETTTGDEGVFGNAARWMSQGEGGHMFGTYWANATAYLLPHALLLQLGVPPGLALRLPGAIVGGLAAPATYLAGRLFARRIGLVAGLLVASSHLQIHVSRMGLGHGFDATWAALAIWGLAGGMLFNDRRRAVIGGMALGAAQLGYVGGRLIDLVALVAVLFVWLSVLFDVAWHRRRSTLVGLRVARRAALGPVLYAVGGAVVVAAPLIRWAIVRPNDYLSRIAATGAAQTGRLGEELAESEPVAVLLRRIGEGVLAFFGAPADQFYFSKVPMLDITWGALCILGVVLALSRMRDIRLLLLLVHVIGGTAVLALSNHSATSAYRITGVLPSAALLAAVALWLLAEGAARDLAQRVMNAVVAAVTITIVGFNLWAYFVHFAPGCIYFDDNTARASVIGRHAGTLPEEAIVLIHGEPTFHPQYYESIEFLSGRRVKRMADIEGDVPRPGNAGSNKWSYSVDRTPLPEDAAGALAEIGGAPVAIYVTPDRDPELPAIRAALPNGRDVTLGRCDVVLMHAWVVQ